MDGFSALNRQAALVLIVLVYLLVGALYAVKTPDWQVPDEPAHYNYVRQLAEEKRFPVLDLGDYDQAYLGRLTSERFPPELSIETVEYEDHQPPLYYLLATPIFLTFDGALTPLRLFSVALGAGVVMLAYAVAATIFPGRPCIALGTAAFVAFVPQHVAMMAGVNNDSLAELLIGVTLWMVVYWLKADGGRWTKETTDDGQKTKDAVDEGRTLAPARSAGETKDGGHRGDRWLVGLGVVLGLGLVTKVSFVPVALTVALVVLVVWWRDRDRRWGQLLRTMALVFGPAVIIAAPWWVYNLSTYGGLDVYGLANHDTVVFEQPRTADWIETYGLRAWLERGITFTFQSFWGQFGWMGVLMPTWLYRVLAAGSGVLVVGLLFWLRGARDNSGFAIRDSQFGIRNSQLVILAVTTLLVVVAYLYYNRTFVQHQGRYLFPALVPIALGVALAVDGLLRLARWPDRLRPLTFAGPFLALVALDLYALWRFIIPALA
jgi:4-amino-4-deoxy-L-arabinose transferase-like glycosyltransferase